MADSNHYETLKVHQNASQTEIKQAYRRLVKIFHPDSNQDTADHEEIVRINAAYEVLGDTQNRLNYDRKLGTNYYHRGKSYGGSSKQRTPSSPSPHSPPSSPPPPPRPNRQERTAAAQQQYQATRKTARNADEQVEEWLRLVYQPVNRVLCRILNSLHSQIEQLAADPFDDELIQEFQDYLTTCRNELKQAQKMFRSLPNPPSLARTAAHLYYCLNQIDDGLDELEYFPLNYDESYLHTGLEMFRIATHLHCEAQESAVGGHRA
jgi:molecular chaperone DnaJ